MTMGPMGKVCPVAAGPEDPDILVGGCEALEAIRGPIVSNFWSEIDWTVLIK